jgi:hypothetical protein
MAPEIFRKSGHGFKVSMRMCAVAGSHGGGFELTLGNALG